jgi:hypothetical protein
MKVVMLILSMLVYGVALAQQHVSRDTRAQNTRSDSVDILHTHVTLHDIDFNNQKISGSCLIHFASKINGLTFLDLDLEGPHADSVSIAGALVNSVHSGPTLRITLPATLNTGDTSSVLVHYSGTPLADPQWGGFTFTGVYAFNMGVGFTSQPHTIGRYWFPCFDNFVERSSYEFTISTSTTNKAVCNGLLIDSVINGNTIQWHWLLSESIPSYLASVAVAPFVTVHDTLAGLNGAVPVEINCIAAEVPLVQASFAQLQQSFTALEQNFGAYQWSKVGYTLVPFTAGAMEHATNIHIGKAFVDGTLSYATLIAHELSHHWFGNLATCSTPQDMWLNEGFASYCELIHTEYVSGSNAYLSAYRDNHFQMLSTAHINDNGYRAISPMDSNYTYSTTVYNKGSDAIHTLRSYLGDSLFFKSVRHYLASNNFDDATTNSLNTSITAITGNNYQHFFNGWILQPGFANFTIDSTFKQPKGNGKYDVQVYVRQRKHKNVQYLQQVPLRINFYKPDFSYVTKVYALNSQCAGPIYELDFDPSLIVLDQDEALSDATTFETKVVKGPLPWTNLPHAKLRVKVNTLATQGDSSLLRISHHWVHPDRFITPQSDYILHDARYWRVEGINLVNLVGLIGFPYNANAANAYLDSNWLKGSEADIKLFYRPNAQSDWTPANDSLVTGGLTDKIGNVYTKSIVSGDYALAIKRPGYTDQLVTDAGTSPCDAVLALPAAAASSSADCMQVSPNPADSFVKIKFGARCPEAAEIMIRNAEGKLIYQANKTGSVQIISTVDWVAGSYFISLLHGGSATPSQVHQIIIH